MVYSHITYSTKTRCNIVQSSVLSRVTPAVIFASFTSVRGGGGASSVVTSSFFGHSFLRSEAVFCERGILVEWTSFEQAAEKRQMIKLITWEDSEKDYNYPLLQADEMNFEDDSANRATRIKINDCSHKCLDTFLRWRRRSNNFLIEIVFCLRCVAIGSSPSLAYCTIFIVMSSEVVE